jgi:hypothetical protein
MTMSGRLPLVLCGVALVSMFSVTPSSASVILTLGGLDFSDPTDNTGGTIKVTISDIAGGVDVVIQNNLVDSGAYLEQIFFNTTAAPLAGPPQGSCLLCASINNVAPAFSFGSDAFQADGDGLYDIWINFGNAAGNRLTPGESVKFQILSSTVGFNETSFVTLSAPAGGHGPFQTAAHIGSLPNDGSDWIAGSTGFVDPRQIPEPAMLLLMTSGLLGLRRLVQRRRNARL